jgi:hypothetical protein
VINNISHDSENEMDKKEERERERKYMKINFGEKNKLKL